MFVKQSVNSLETQLCHFIFGDELRWAIAARFQQLVLPFKAAIMNFLRKDVSRVSKQRTDEKFQIETKIENLAKEIKSWKFTDWQQVRLKSVYATHTNTIHIWTSILVLNKLCVLFAFPQWKRLKPMLEKMLKKSPRLFFLSSSSKEFFSCSNNWSLKWAKNCSICTSEEKINGDCATIVEETKSEFLVIEMPNVDFCGLLRDFEDWTQKWRRNDETNILSLIASQMTFPSPRSTNMNRFFRKKWKTGTRNTFSCTRKGKFPVWPQFSLTENLFNSLVSTLKMHQVINKKLTSSSPPTAMNFSQKSNQWPAHTSRE